MWMLQARPVRRLSGALAPMVVLTLLAMAAPQALADSSGVHCRPVALSVPPSLAVTEPVAVPLPDEPWRIAGTLCSPPGATTAQVLLSGSTYGKEYWNAGFRPGEYSYARHQAAAGHATVSLDRLGIGQSSHPQPELITSAAQAKIASLFVGALRDGRFGDAYDTVVIAGHSYGSAVALIEASTYHDVDGVVVTGFTHEIGPEFVTEVLPSLAPAATVDPERFGSLPAGYLTTRDDVHRAPFYHAPGADPAAIDYDESTKQTTTMTELGTIGRALTGSAAVTAPVLAVFGDHDPYTCGVGTTCADPLSLVDAERRFYPRARSFETAVIPNTGHSLTLHSSARQSAAAIAEWIDRTVPNSSR